MDGKAKQKRHLDDDTKEKNGTTKKKRTEDTCLPSRPLQPRPPAVPPTDKVEKKKIIEEDIKVRVRARSHAANAKAMSLHWFLMLISLPATPEQK